MCQTYAKLFLQMIENMNVLSYVKLFMGTVSTFAYEKLVLFKIFPETMLAACNSISTQYLVPSMS